MSAPLLFIGLDSADPDLIDRWTTAGLLPNLARLRRASVTAPVRNLAGFGNGVFWPSLNTGVNPARHGRFYFEHLEPGTYRFAPFDERRDFLVESVWETADKLGRKVALLDLVRSPARPMFNGRMLCGWMTHDRPEPTHSSPPEWLGEVIEAFGPDPWEGSSDRARQLGATMTQMRDQSLSRIRARTRLTRQLLLSGDFDAISTTYSDPHDIGHLCWHLHDPTHPLHDGDERARLGDPLLQVYQSIDLAIGELIDSCPAHNLVVVGGPGMTRHFFANRFLDRILRSLEFGPYTGDMLRLDALDRAVARLPWRLRRRIPSSLGMHMGDELAADRRHRRFFSIPHNDNAGAIRVNLVGREPCGRVQPGREYLAVLDEIEAAMLELRNLDSGAPLVEEVIRVSSHVSGPALDRLPDLLVSWNRTGPVNCVGSNRVGEIHDPLSSLRTGDHTAHGFVYALGPDIGPARQRPTCSPMDIGATVAALLGVPVTHLDGKPIALRYSPRTAGTTSCA